MLHSHLHVTDLFVWVLKSECAWIRWASISLTPHRVHTQCAWWLCLSQVSPQLYSPQPCLLCPYIQGAIGILDKTDMDHFAEIFVAYQKLGKSNDPAGWFHMFGSPGSSDGTVPEIGKLQADLAPWTSLTSRGKLRAISNDHAFSIK